MTKRPQHLPYSALLAGLALVGCALGDFAHAAEPPPPAPRPGVAPAVAMPANSNPAPAAATPATSTATPAAVRPRTTDRLDLDATTVTGSRELPKVLYIVPWKRAEQGDLPTQPFNTLLDETLAPLDRDEFRREVLYYAELNAKPAATPAP